MKLYYLLKILIKDRIIYEVIFKSDDTLRRLKILS